MRILPVLALALFLPACIIVPAQNVCVFPSASPGTVGTGAAGSPVPGGSTAPGTTTGGTTTGGGVTVGGGGNVTTSPTPAVVASGGIATTLNLDAFGPAATPLTTQVGATFSSDNQAIATVDANGVVTGVGNGATTVNVTVGGVTTRVAVTVQQKPTTLRVSTSLPGDPRTVALTAVPLKLSATATDSAGKPIAGVTLRYDPDAGTASDVILLDNLGNVQLQAPPLTKASGTIRVVTPSGQASTDADSIKVTIGL